MKKFECNREGCMMRPCRIEVTDSCANTRLWCLGYTDGSGAYPSEWKEIHETAEGLQDWGPHVFKHPDCPDWAKFAAVDGGSEKGYWYSDEPSPDGAYWRTQRDSKLLRIGEGSFKISGRWEDTLLKRSGPPTKGQWVKFDGGYGMITSINKDGSYWLSTLTGPQRVDHVTPVDVYPFDDQQLKGMVGCVFEHYRWSRIVVSAEIGGCGFRVKVGDQVFNAEQLLTEAVFLNGRPCGNIR